MVVLRKHLALHRNFRKDEQKEELAKRMIEDSEVKPGKIVSKPVKRLKRGKK